MVDLNGDGRKELRDRQALHGAQRPRSGRARAAGRLLVRIPEDDDGKQVEWVKHVVDYSSRTGGGMQIPVVDLDGDGDLDFAVGGQERAVSVRESDQKKMSLSRTSTRHAKTYDDALSAIIAHLRAESGTVHMLGSDGCCTSKRPASDSRKLC